MYSIFGWNKRLNEFKEAMIDKEDRDMAELLPGSSQDDKMSSRTDNNNCGQRRPTRMAEKYGLRPRTIIRRIQLERSKENLSQRETKTPRHRPPPLSKYRRKTANARERHRMKEINDAFETLRRVLPDFCSRRAASAMTKITTLKLAVNYIRVLSHILQDGHPGDISFFDGLNFADISVSSQVATVSSPVLTSLNYPTHLVHSQSPASSSNSPVARSSSPVASYTSSCPSANFRGPLGSSSSSSSDLNDLLSDDSCVLEDNLDAFDDIAALPETDPFALLLVPDGDPLVLGS